MRYGFGDILRMLQTPAGRITFGDGVFFRLWPLASRVAATYRRRVVGGTRVIAVVGSFGKSTTTRAVAIALGLPLDERMLANAWTSLALALLRIRRAQRHAAIEVGIAAPGQMAQYARLVRPDVTVVTGIGSEHRRSLVTLEVTRAEKSLMVAALPPAGVAVLNGDDPNAVWMRGRTAARVVTYGFGPECDVRAAAPRLDWPRGMRFTVTAFGASHDVAVALYGRHMIYAALAAIAVACVEGVPLAVAVARLGGVRPAPGRMEPVALAGEVTILRDDFKSAVETMLPALDTLAEVPARRRLVLLGDIAEPGEGQRALHREVGMRAAQAASHLVVVGHALERYAAGARQAGMPRGAIHDGGRTPRDAATVLARLLEPGDVVLIKGRGTQMLDRVRLILEGRDVRCDIVHCDLRLVECERCPMLERGWGKHRPVD